MNLLISSIQSMVLLLITNYYFIIYNFFYFFLKKAIENVNWWISWICVVVRRHMWWVTNNNIVSLHALMFRMVCRFGGSFKDTISLSRYDTTVESLLDCFGIVLKWWLFPSVLTFSLVYNNHSRTTHIWRAINCVARRRLKRM